MTSRFETLNRTAVYLAPAAFLGTLLASYDAAAVVPGTITHQGRLFDADGAPVTDTLDVTFTIYDAANGGNSVWTETISVAFDEGYYSVELGQDSPFDATVIDGSTRYMGVTVAGDDEMSPRGTVGSVPYAMLANDVNGDINPSSVNIDGYGPVVDENGQWVGEPIPGSQGPQGPQGPAGAAGTAGAQGPQGVAGPQGTAGAQGPQGTAGAQGPQGANGAQGPQGTAGAQGPQGTAGAQGPQGAAGATGPQGANGAQGPQGTAGAQGPQGAAGAIGPQGAAGAIGPQGAAGATGAQGPQGLAGPAGPQGVAGAIGPQGAAGAAGAAGPQGPQGASGASGITFVTTAGCGLAGTGGAACGVAAANAFIGPTVNVTLAAGQRAHLVIEKSLGTTAVGGASGLNIYPCYQLSGGGALTTQGGGIFGLSVAQNERIPFGINYVFSGLAAGTYAIGMCGASAAGSANWNNNEWGYISALVF